jgi:hypothetical protein
MVVTLVLLVELGFDPDWRRRICSTSADFYMTFNCLFIQSSQNAVGRFAASGPQLAS